MKLINIRLCLAVYTIISTFHLLKMTLNILKHPCLFNIKIDTSFWWCYKYLYYRKVSRPRRLCLVLKKATRRCMRRPAVVAGNWSDCAKAGGRWKQLNPQFEPYGRCVPQMCCPELWHPFLTAETRWRIHEALAAMSFIYSMFYLFLKRSFIFIFATVVLISNPIFYYSE